MNHRELISAVYNDPRTYQIWATVAFVVGLALLIETDEVVTTIGAGLFFLSAGAMFAASREKLKEGSDA